MDSSSHRARTCEQVVKSVEKGGGGAHEEKTRKFAFDSVESILLT